MAKESIIIGAEIKSYVQNVFGSNPYNFYKLLGEALNTLEIINTKIASNNDSYSRYVKRNVIRF